jgi:PleD family two-component response regulator
MKFAAYRRMNSIVERNCFLEHQNRWLRDTVRNLSRLVYVDGLTGLANRRYFDAARYGGEEIALLLPGLEAWKTTVVVDKLRQCVAEISGRNRIMYEPVHQPDDLCRRTPVGECR